MPGPVSNSTWQWRSIDVIPPRYRIFLAVGPLLASSWLFLSIFNPDVASRAAEYPAIGFILGTMFGQATLASAWTAFGPLPLVYRLPLSIAWIVVLWIAIVISLGGDRGQSSMVALFGACLFGQWIVVQLPLWGLAFYYGVQLRHVTDAPSPGTRRERQFGIRQLMILTAIVAVLLGTGRAILLAIADKLGKDFSREAPVFVFLAGAAIVMTLPLLLAGLLPRWWLAAVFGVSALIVLGTVWELPLINMVQGPGGGPDQWHLAWINFFTAGWVLVTVLLMRAGGYRLASPSES